MSEIPERNRAGTHSSPAPRKARDRSSTKSDESSVPRASSTARKVRPGDTKGGLLERRAARLEFADGALTRLRVNVQADQADSGKDILTDIDILSIGFDTRLRRFTASLECKSGKGQSGEPYTIVWLAGFRQLLKLDGVSIVRPTFSSRGRALAKSLGIATLDEALIGERERALGALPETFAHLDGEECILAESKTDTQLRGLPEIAYFAKYFKGEALLADSTAVVAALHAFGDASQRQGVLPEPAGTVLAGHALVCFLLATLQDAGRLNEVRPIDIESRLHRAISLGDPDDSFVLPLLERADALLQHIQERTHRTYIANGAEPLRIDVPSLRDAVLEKPPFLHEYSELVSRLRASSQVARELLQTAELASFDALLGGESWRAPGFAHLFSADHRALLRVAVRCLNSITGNVVAEQLDRVLRLPYRNGHAQGLERRGVEASSPPEGADQAEG